MNEAEIVKRKGPQASKLLKIGLWLGWGSGCLMAIALLVATTPDLLFHGYCWGWWGRSSLWLQHFYQCECPANSQEMRYPPQIDVIVSACSNPRIRLSPSGQSLYVEERTSDPPIMYILDLQSMQKTQKLEQPFSHFLTDDLVLIQSAGDVINLKTGQHIPLQYFGSVHPDAYLNGEENPAALAESLRTAKQIFVVENEVVALSANVKTLSDQSFIVNDRFMPGYRDAESFLHQNNIPYQRILPNYLREIKSPNGKWIARDDGIYLADTDQLIVEAPQAFVKGWTSDGNAAIYSADYGLCVLTSGGLIFDDTWCAISVPQPVLKVWVPEQYR